MKDELNKYSRKLKPVEIGIGLSAASITIFTMLGPTIFPGNGVVLWIHDVFVFGMLPIAVIVGLLLSSRRKSSEDKHG